MILVLGILISSLSSFANDTGNEPEVFQREFIFTHRSVHPNIQTYGVNTCVAVYLFNGDGHAIIAHFDASIKAKKELSKMITLLGEGIKAKIFGGVEGARLNTFGEIYDSLKYYNIPVVEFRQNERSSDSMSLSFNLETNEVSEYDEMNSYDAFDIVEGKLKRLHIGPKRMFRHMDSLGGGDIVEKQKSSTGFRPIF